MLPYYNSTFSLGPIPILVDNTGGGAITIAHVDCDGDNEDGRGGVCRAAKSGERLDRPRNIVSNNARTRTSSCQEMHENYHQNTLRPLFVLFRSSGVTIGSEIRKFKLSLWTHNS